MNLDQGHAVSDPGLASASVANPPRSDGAKPSYQVIARRYRPQRFDELIGQSQIAHALAGAIESGRIGHAYLFTGARGVGKTSTARILARSLNCVEGPTISPCGVCDACQAISRGDDVDVLEVDGASNRGIDEIRQLRETIGSRPVRGRFKIYIIDEVHMLTREAFNALLKTLEEPPRHVKFFFCTTDPEKIPITVLSRCQRFDFPPVDPENIVARLSDICRSEGVEAEPAALALLARRAAGSVRDSQSLLEQLLSYSSGLVREDDVYQLLGTARSARVLTIAGYLADRDAGSALAELDGALEEAADVGQIAEQMVSLFRDLMVTAAGGAADLLAVPTAEREQVVALADRFGLRTALAALQILDQALTRMRETMHPRTVVETAVVRICLLEDLSRLAELLGGKASGGAARGNESSHSMPGGQKKTADSDDGRSQASMTSPQTGNQTPTAARIVPDRPARPEGSIVQPLPVPKPQTLAAPSPVVRPPATPAGEIVKPASTENASIPTPARHAPPEQPVLSVPPREPSAIVSPPAAPVLTPPKPIPTSIPVDNADVPSAAVSGDVSTSDGAARVSASDDSTTGGDEINELWNRAILSMGDLNADLGDGSVKLIWKGPGRLASHFENVSAFEFTRLQRNSPRIEAALSQQLGRTVRLEMHLDRAAEVTTATKASRPNKQELMRNVQANPYILKTLEVFDGEIDDVSDAP